MAIGSVLLFAAKYANSWEVLAVGRLVIGVNAGLNAGISPMYLSEISPVALRGAVGTVYQLIITISILISQGESRYFQKSSSNQIIFFAFVAHGGSENFKKSRQKKTKNS